MMLDVFSCYVQYSVRRRAYEAVVKRKTDAVLGRQMSVDDVAIKLVCVAQSRKKSLRLRYKVVLASNVYEPFTAKLIKLLVIAEYSTSLGVLCIVQERHNELAFTLKKNEWDAWRIMSVLHTGGERTLILCKSLCDGGRYLYVVANTAKCICCYRAGAKKRECVTVYLDYGRLKTYLTLATANDSVYHAVKICNDVLCTCGRWASRKISRGSGNCNAALTYQLSCYRVRGTTNGYRIKSTRNTVWNDILFLHYHRKRSGHKCACKRVIKLVRVCVLFRILGSGDVNNKGVVRGSALCGVYFCRRLRVCCRSAESVNGLCWERNESASLYYVSGLCDSVLVYYLGGYIKNFGFHLLFSSCYVILRF